MTIALIAALVLTIAAFVWLLDRQDKRAHSEREALRRDHQLNLTRVQDPATAVTQSLYDAYDEPTQPPNGQPVEVEIDEDETNLWPLER